MTKTNKIGYIFRPWIRTRDGRVIYARNYGKRAFMIPVYDNDEEKKRA